LNVNAYECNLANKLDLSRRFVIVNAFPGIITRSTTDFNHAVTPIMRNIELPLFYPETILSPKALVPVGRPRSLEREQKKIARQHASNPQS
jgi:hypothetical protein